MKMQILQLFCAFILLALSSQKEIPQYFDLIKELSNTRSSVRGIQQTEEGKLLIGFLDNKINLHSDLKSKREVEFYFMLNKTETLITFKVNGELLLAGYHTGAIEVLQLPYGFPLKRFYQKEGRIIKVEMMKTPDVNDFVVAISSNSTELEIWNYNTTKHFQTIKMGSRRPLVDFHVYSENLIFAVNTMSVMYIIEYNQVKAEFEIQKSFKISDHMVKAMERSSSDLLAVGLGDGTIVEINPWTFAVSSYFISSNSEVSKITQSKNFIISIDVKGSVSFCRKIGNLVFFIPRVHSSAGKSIIVTSETEEILTVATGDKDGIVKEWVPRKRTMASYQNELIWEKCDKKWMWTANALECGSCWVQCPLQESKSQCHSVFSD